MELSQNGPAGPNAIFAHPRLRLLWSGQLFSAIGDEAYKVAVVAVAVQMAGAEAGFLAAIQAGSAFFLSVVAGAWADRWPRTRTLIVVDCVRALVVAIPLLSLGGFPLNVWTLIPVVAIVSSLSALFDPALVALLPDLSPNPQVLHSANGWLDATRRLARIGGPVLVAGLSTLIAPIHFFTLDALSFLLSALSIAWLSQGVSLASHPSSARSALEQWKESFHLVGSHSLLKVSLFCSGTAWALWSLAFQLGGALLVRETSAHPVHDYALLIGAYGVGNVLSNLFWSNRAIRHPGRVMFSGFFILGLGFIGVGLSHSSWIRLTSAACAAVGGPMDDLSFLAVLQNEFKGAQISKVFRVLMAVGHGFTLLALVLSPWLFRTVSASSVLVGSGALLSAIGIVGALRFFSLMSSSIAPPPGS